MVDPYRALLLLYVAQRLFEVFWSLRNRKRVLARGGEEYGRGQIPWMVALHLGLLVGCWFEAGLPGRSWPPPALFALLMITLLLANVLRAWTMLALGDRWNVRVIIEPGRPPARKSPFHRLRHPNYLGVTLEGVALPLLHGAWATATLFTLANAVLLLGFRIPLENTLLHGNLTGGMRPGDHDS